MYVQVNFRHEFYIKMCSRFNSKSIFPILKQAVIKSRSWKRNRLGWNGIFLLAIVASFTSVHFCLSGYGQISPRINGYNGGRIGGQPDCLVFGWRQHPTVCCLQVHMRKEYKTAVFLSLEENSNKRHMRTCLPVYLKMRSLSTHSSHL